MQIFVGLLIIVGGALLVLKAGFIYNNFGPIPFFERFLSTEGGSRLGYKLIGLLIVFFGLLIMTNMIGAFLGWLLGPLVKVGRP